MSYGYDSPKDVVVSAIAALNAGDLEGYFNLHTTDTTVYDSGRVLLQQAAQYREQLSAFCALHPKFRVMPSRFVCEENVVVMESALLLHGIESDEREPEVVIFDLDGGRIAATTVYSRASIAARSAEGNGA